MIIFKWSDVAPAHAVHRATTKFLHRPARSLRRPISLLSMSRAVAGVQPGTSQSIKPRERDLGDLHLFFLVRILTRPTNHPRHAACASNNQSKPVRPRFLGGLILPETCAFAIRPNRPRVVRRDLSASFRHPLAHSSHSKKSRLCLPTRAR